eukprot:260923-Pyramimonas_sp.AAC.1
MAGRASAASATRCVPAQTAACTRYTTYMVRARNNMARSDEPAPPLLLRVELPRFRKHASLSSTPGTANPAWRMQKRRY